MRVLDLGAHDGFVSAFVADQLGPDDDLCIDGIELNSHGVEEFNRRITDRGIAGLCKQGLAEDAPYLFEPHSYDAVVAFELIEHVPDVEAFLDACETMLKPDGRVYISTPDGTFGAGQNPHHLRVYRALDLAGIMCRRGDLQGMIVGPDTITALSYVPWGCIDPEPPHGLGEVAIYCGPGWMTWSPMNIEAPGGLGGSETAACRLAEEMHLLGYAVTVYGECDPGIIGQVMYRHHSTFDPLVKRRFVIASRVPWIADRAINADTVALWMHDTDYADQLTPQRTERFDAIMVLSQWQRDHVVRMYPWTEDKLVVTANGVHAEYFTSEPASERNPHRVIVSSSPDRGLDLLLEWWPQVRKLVPDAELVYAYADVYGAVAAARPEVAEHQAKVAELAKQPGVTNLGALSQPELAMEMRQSGVWAHPSWNTPHDVAFYETFCIGAVEAAAAGCVVLCSAWGALFERLRDLSPVGLAKPNSSEWIPLLVEAMNFEPGVALPVITWADVAKDFATVTVHPPLTA